MRLVAFNGSPRKEGDTSRLLRTIVAMAEEKGYETEYFDLIDHDIGHCLGCMGCKKGDRCVIDDGMTGFYDVIREADVLVFGTPIYMGSETGLFKDFCDRLYAFLALSQEPGRLYETRLEGERKAVAVLTCGNPEGHIVYHYMNGKLATLFSGLLGMYDFNSQIVPGTLGMKDVLESPYAQGLLRTMEREL